MARARSGSCRSLSARATAGDLQEHFRDFLFREAVGERRLHMQLRAVERRDHRKIDNAPRPAVEARRRASWQENLEAVRAKAHIHGAIKREREAADPAYREQ